jgi:hypothetical protein
MIQTAHSIAATAPTGQGRVLDEIRQSRFAALRPERVMRHPEVLWTIAREGDLE